MNSPSSKEESSSDQPSGRSNNSDYSAVLSGPVRPYTVEIPETASRHFFGIILISSYVFLSFLLLLYAIYQNKESIAAISAAILVPMGTIVSAVIGFYFGSSNIAALKTSKNVSSHLTSGE